MLTGTGAILDNTGARVPLILSDDIEKILALTRSVPHIFQKTGFYDHGKVRELSAANLGDLPASLLEYDCPGRDPQVFTWSRNVV